MPKDFYDLRYMLFEPDVEEEREKLIQEEKLEELRGEIKILAQRQEAIIVEEKLGYFITQEIDRQIIEELKKEVTKDDLQSNTDSGDTSMAKGTATES